MIELGPRQVPKRVTRVGGCNCGGLNSHLTSCSIFDQPPAVAVAAVADAHRRLADHVDELNRELRA